MPHATLHLVEPEQSTLQPPEGQLTVHELLPPHDTVAPEATVRLQVLVP